MAARTWAASERVELSASSGSRAISLTAFGTKKVGSAPAAPAHLSKRAKSFWRDVVSTWAVDDAAGLELLRRACEASDRADEAAAELAEHGSLTFTTRYGEVRPHPAVAIERDARVAVARLLRELRLDDPPDDSRPPRNARK